MRILSNYFFPLLFVTLLSFFGKIWYVQSFRATVTEFYVLDARLETLHMENTQLILDKSLLLRTDRLADYGRKKLKLVRAVRLKNIK